MIIKLQSNYTKETLVITLSGDKEVPSYPDHPLVGSLKYELGKASGHYGHSINPSRVNPLDLVQACHELPSFSVLEVPNLVDSDELPDGVYS